MDDNNSIIRNIKGRTNMERIPNYDPRFAAHAACWIDVHGNNEREEDDQEEQEARGTEGS